MIFAFFSNGQIPNSFLNLSGSVSYTILRMPACCLPCTHTHTQSPKYITSICCRFKGGTTNTQQNTQQVESCTTTWATNPSNRIWALHTKMLAHRVYYILI